MRLELTDKEVDFIASAIAQLQFGVVHQQGMSHLLAKIQAQANEAPVDLGDLFSPPR